MHNTKMSAGDVNATYGGTWLYVKWEGISEFRPFYLDEVETHRGVLVHGRDATNNERVSFSLYADTTEVMWDHPDMGYVNYQGFAIHHQRAMARQWKRGLRGSQISSSVYGKRMAEYLRRLRYSFDNPDHICELFNPSYPPFGECVDSVRHGQKFAVAFSKEFAIEADPRYTLPLLRYKKFAVGVVNGSEAVLSDGNDHLSHRLGKALAGG